MFAPAMDSVRASLKEECLSVILENFERFYGAFKSSQGGILGKLFEFLERAYSETLFQKLLNSGYLKAEYLEFLINPHLRHLNLEGFDGDLMPALLKQLSMIESNITFLKTAQLWNIDVDQFKQLVSSIPKVEVIEISEKIYPEVLEEIGRRCPLLRVLKIVNCDIDEVGLMNIFLNANGEYENKVHLEQLDLTSTMVLGSGIAFVLSHAPALRSLDHCDTTKVLYEMHVGDLQNDCLESSKKYSLTSLSFPSWEKNVSDTLKICTALCPDVTSLSIDCLENDEQLLLCAEFLRLKDLKINVRANTFSFNGITQFLKSRGKTLLSIHLEGGCASAEAIVEHCPKLRSLKLCSVNFEPLDKKKECLFSTAKLSNLRTFAITCANFTVKEIADSVKVILSNAKSLSSVNFSGCEGLSGDFVHGLFEFGLLQVNEVNLSSSDVSVTAVADLLSRGSLQKLSVANCLNIAETDYLNLLNCRCNGEVSITLSICDEDESFDFDDYDEYDFDVYDDYDFDVYNGYDYDPDYYDNDFCDYDDYDCDYDDDYDNDEFSGDLG